MKEILEAIARLKRGEGEGTPGSFRKYIVVSHPFIERVEAPDHLSHITFEAHPINPKKSHELDLLKIRAALRRKGYALGAGKKAQSDSMLESIIIMHDILQDEKDVGSIVHIKRGTRRDLHTISFKADHAERLAQIFFGSQPKRLPPRRQKLLKGRQK